MRDRIEAGIKAAGFNQPKKLYAVYYDGSSAFSCGGGAWPSTLVGNVGALYLHGMPPGAPACSETPLATSEDHPGYWEFALIHEIFHVLGAVARCAPHFTLEGHVSDSPNDLMYAGDLVWEPSVLDISHDDYFDHNNAGCLDVAKSVFIQPTPRNAVPPPSWKTFAGKRRQAHVRW